MSVTEMPDSSDLDEPMGVDVGPTVQESEAAEPQNAPDVVVVDESAAADEPTDEPTDEVAEAAAPETDLPPADRLGARLPFWMLGGTWVLLVSFFSYVLWPIAEPGLMDDPMYAWFILGGAALTAIGFFLAVVAWLAVRSSVEPGQRRGVASVIWKRALLWTAGGVVLWWMALLLLDLRRTGLVG